MAQDKNRYLISQIYEKICEILKKIGIISKKKEG